MNLILINQYQQQSKLKLGFDSKTRSQSNLMLQLQDDFWQVWQKERIRCGQKLSRINQRYLEAKERQGPAACGYSLFLADLKEMVSILKESHGCVQQLGGGQPVLQNIGQYNMLRQELIARVGRFEKLHQMCEEYLLQLQERARRFAPK